MKTPVFSSYSAPELMPPDAPADPLATAQTSALVPAAPTLPLDQHPAAVYLAGLSAGGRRTQRAALDSIARLLGYSDALAVPWQQLRYQHTAAIRAQLADAYAPATARRYLVALGRVLAEARRLGLMTADELALATDLKRIGGSSPPAGRALDGDELTRLLAVCADDQTPAGVRDAALIGLLYATGLRRSEAVALDRGDYTRASGALLVRKGKGKKARTVYAGDASGLLDEYLVLRGAEAGPLFVRARRGGHLATTRLSDGAVRDILDRRAAAAGVDPVRPHDMRRTTISDLLDAGADIAAVQQLAGHADPATTAKYDRRGERAKQKAAGLLKLPRRTLPLDD
jgi:integrase/recombinase XerD